MLLFSSINDLEYIPPIVAIPVFLDYASHSQDTFHLIFWIHTSFNSHKAIQGLRTDTAAAAIPPNGTKKDRNSCSTKVLSTFQGIKTSPRQLSNIWAMADRSHNLRPPAPKIVEKKKSRWSWLLPGGDVRGEREGKANVQEEGIRRRRSKSMGAHEVQGSASRGAGVTVQEEAKVGSKREKGQEMGIGFVGPGEEGYVGYSGYGYAYGPGTGATASDSTPPLSPRTQYIVPVPGLVGQLPKEYVGVGVGAGHMEEGEGHQRSRPGSSILYAAYDLGNSGTIPVAIPRGSLHLERPQTQSGYSSPVGGGTPYGSPYGTPYGTPQNQYVQTGMQGRGLAPLMETPPKMSYVAAAGTPETTSPRSSRAYGGAPGQLQRTPQRKTYQGLGLHMQYDTPVGRSPVPGYRRPSAETPLVRVTSADASTMYGANSGIVSGVTSRRVSEEMPSPGLSSPHTARSPIPQVPKEFQSPRSSNANTTTTQGARRVSAEMTTARVVSSSTGRRVSGGIANLNAEIKRQHLLHGTWQGGRFRPPWDALTSVGGSVAGETEIEVAVAEEEERSNGPEALLMGRNTPMRTKGRRTVSASVTAGLPPSVVALRRRVLERSKEVFNYGYNDDLASPTLPWEAGPIAFQGLYSPAVTASGTVASADTYNPTTALVIKPESIPEVQTCIIKAGFNPPRTYKTHLLLMLLAEHALDTLLDPGLAVEMLWRSTGVYVHPAHRIHNKGPHAGSSPALASNHEGKGKEREKGDEPSPKLPSPATLPTLFNIGQMELSRHRYFSARRTFQAAVAQDQYEVACWVQLGFVSCLLGDFEGAARAYGGALKAMDRGGEGVEVVNYAVLGGEVVVRCGDVEGWFWGAGRGMQGGGIAIGKVMRVREERKRNLGGREYTGLQKVVARASG
ncbi:hypothetical protein BDZ91DRAFT_811478 [Kalaharituber pfeilii]|nr:hypothetical protein BDZ91DRAFT_811478 [Kalaharituber pfeilii]